MPITEQQVFTQDITVYSYDIDRHFHAKLLYYFQVLQEAAGYHAWLKGKSVYHLQQEGMTWMITRTKLTIDRYAVWPERLTLETWPQDPYKLYAPRGIKLKDRAGNDVLHSISWWVVFDLEKGRPIRPQAVVDALPSPPKDDTEHYYDPALPKRRLYDESITTLATYKPIAHYYDTDTNYHVNNVSYVDWILRSLPDEFMDAHAVAEIDVSWLQQTYRDDDITVYTGSSDSHAMDREEANLLHKIVRHEPDGSETEVFVAETWWKPREEMVKGFSSALLEGLD